MRLAKNVNNVSLAVDGMATVTNRVCSIDLLFNKLVTEFNV